MLVVVTVSLVVDGLGLGDVVVTAVDELGVVV